jgi:NAD(P)-dependent dehydrogenase (short-subunit alcohol dehydrogenase family)
MRDIVGKVAFITGGVSGIGLGIAKSLCSAGMKVVVTYRNPRHRDEALSQLQALRGQVHAMQLDVTDRAAMAAAAAEVERAFGKVHILCNNAGVNVLGPMDEATYEDWDWMLGVNLTGAINGIVTFVPRIKAHGEGGHVVNVASMGSFITGPSAGVYATSKFALRGLSESLRYSLAPHGIGVSVVCPGLTRSDIYASTLTRPARLANTAFPVDDARMEQMQAVHALGMEPEEVGRKVLEGILREDFYIFTHPEFKQELALLFQEILQAMPEMTEEHPPRLAIEALRRQSKAEATKAVERLKEHARDNST